MNFIKKTVSLGIICALTATHTLSAANTDAPNIICIPADEIGTGDVRAINPESKIPTPYMDSLAKDGMLFTDAHSGLAVCPHHPLRCDNRQICLAQSAQKWCLNGYIAEKTNLQDKHPEVVQKLTALPEKYKNDGKRVR